MSELETHHFTSHDGTRLAWQQIGKDGFPVVLSNGLGGTLLAWHYIVEHLRGRFRIISWDYRGLYGSERPARKGSYSVAHHARDLEALLNHLDIQEAIFLGWSMGVQVNFEFARFNAHRMRGLAAFNGTWGRVFDTAFNSPLARFVIPRIFDAVQERAELTAKGIAAATNTTVYLDLMKLAGAVHKNIDEKLIHGLARGFAGLDYVAYSENMKALGLHDASDVLPAIACPALIVTGDRDLFTPVSTAQTIVQRMPRAEMMVLKGGTHYTPLEFPREITTRLDSLFSRAGVQG